MGSPLRGPLPWSPRTISDVSNFQKRQPRGLSRVQGWPSARGSLGSVLPPVGTEILNEIFREEPCLGTGTVPASSEAREWVKCEVELLPPEEARMRAGLSGDAEGPQRPSLQKHAHPSTCNQPPTPLLTFSTTCLGQATHSRAVTAFTSERISLLRVAPFRLLCTQQLERGFQNPNQSTLDLCSLVLPWDPSNLTAKPNTLQDATCLPLFNLSVFLSCHFLHCLPRSGHPGLLCIS